MTRLLASELGLTLLPQSQFASTSLTALLLPDNIDADRVLERMLSEHRVAIGKGVGSLATKLIRIGHMGHVAEADIAHCMDALTKTMTELKQEMPC